MGDDRLVDVDPSPEGAEPDAGGQKSPSASLRLGEIFEKNCGYYLHLGMTLTEYWDGDPRAVKWYRDKRKLDLEYMNYGFWLQGAYIYEAMIDVSPILRPFTKNAKPVPYGKEPFKLFVESSEAEAKAKKEKQTDLALIAFKAKVNAINQQRQGGGEQDGTGRSGV